jgi:hypothetical protein
MPQRRISSAVAVAAAALALALAAAPAVAAPPPNDTIDTATEITGFPFSDPRIAITEAGTEPFDAELVPLCTEGAAEHSIWYRFEATQEGILDLRAITRGWDATIAISPGVPTGEDSFSDCGTGDAYVEVEAGETYYIAVYAREAGTARGTLSFTADFSPKSVFTTIDAVSLTAGGSIAVSGTYTCSGKKPLGFVTIRVAPNTRSESSVDIQDIVCTGTPQPYSAEVAPVKGRWRGTVEVEVSAFICGAIACEQEAAETTFAVPR